MSGHKDLIVWQVADNLVKKIYSVSSRFPKEEIYSSTSQLRRAALSVVLNIVEGYARNNRKEFKNFLRIALGSLSEVDYLLDFSFEQKYLADKDYQVCKSLREECGRILWKLYVSQ